MTTLLGAARPRSGRGVILRRAALVLVAAFVVAIAGVAIADKPRQLPDTIESIVVEARPIEHFVPGAPERRRFGALEWVGGLVLTSTYRGFGGLSALRFLDAEGRRFLAVSDAGLWLEGRIVTEGERPIAIRDARMAPLRDHNDRPIAGSWRGDAESLAIVGDDALVGFEALNQIRRFSLSPDVMRAVPTIVPVPPELGGLRRSRGLEALALVPPGSAHAGRLLAIAESPARGEQWLRAWLLLGGAPIAFRIPQRDQFDATDATVLGNGDVLLLERRVQIPFGVWIRIRRFPVAHIAPGATVDGEVIFEADFAHTIDNMEGIAHHRGADGATYLTLISDDNYAVLQRTLLLRFRLVE